MHLIKKSFRVASLIMNKPLICKKTVQKIVKYPSYRLRLWYITQEESALSLWPRGCFLQLRSRGKRERYLTHKSTVVQWGILADLWKIPIINNSHQECLYSKNSAAYCEYGAVEMGGNLLIIFTAIAVHNINIYKIQAAYYFALNWAFAALNSNRRLT